MFLVLSGRAIDYSGKPEANGDCILIANGDCTLITLKREREPAAFGESVTEANLREPTRVCDGKCVLPHTHKYTIP